MTFFTCTILHQKLQKDCHEILWQKLYFSVSTKQQARHFSFLTQLPKAAPFSIFVLLEGFIVMKSKTLQLYNTNTFWKETGKSCAHGSFSGTLCDVQLGEHSVAMIRMCCHHWTRCSQTTVVASLVCQSVRLSVCLYPLPLTDEE